MRDASGHSGDSAESQLRQLADSMAQPVCLARPDGWVYWYNERWYEYTGAKPGELDGWGWRRFHDPLHLTRVEEAWLACIRTGEPFDMEFPLRSADGGYRWFRAQVMPLRDETGAIARWYGTCTDVSESRESARRIAELNADLSKRVEELETLLRVLPVGVFIAADRECTMITGNPAGLRMLGLAEGSNASKTGRHGERLPFRVFQEGREVPGPELPMQRCARTGEPVMGESYDVEHRDGSLARLYEFAVPLRDEQGNVRGCVGVFIDLTAEHRAQLARQESEARFRVMADRAPVLIWLSDELGARTWFNRPWLDFVGLPMEQLVGTGWVSVIHPEDAERYRAAYQEAVRGRSEFQETYRLRRHDGVYRWVLSHATPLFEPDDTFTGMAGTSLDITELEEARQVLQAQAAGLEQVVVERTEALQQSRERLRIAERLASIGTLAAGIGHDLSNLLLPVRVSLESIQLKSGADIQEDIETIRQSADYMSRLSTGLRLLAVDPQNASRGQVGTDVEEWWEQTAVLLKNLAPRGVELAARIGPARAAISPAGLTQAVFNLVQNAGEAIRQSGRGQRISVSAREMEGVVEVQVEDDGPGMPEEVRARCMDPFFTTKTRGMSTGLGLALVVGIVSKAGGTVEVSSQKDRGSVFRLKLPAAARPGAPGGRAGVTAAVELADARLRAFIVYELGVQGVEVRPGGEAGGCDLWVTDRPEPERVRAHLGAGPAKRVVAVTGRADVAAERVTILPPEFKSGVIRGEIQRAVRALRGEDAGPRQA